MIPKRALLVVGTFLLALLLYIDRVCISTAKDPITASLNLTDKQFGWIMSAFALGYALFQTPSGVLADRLGPRSVLTGIVLLWSLFTGLTAAAWNYSSMLVIRFLFGAGEAGAFPGIARAIYSWLPMKERGLATGINFAGGRLGAMFAMPLIATLITTLGWKQTFVVLMLIGFVWSLAWYWWFRNLPEEHPSISTAERDYILANRQQTSATATELPFSTMMASGNMWLAMTQYFCSNFTFFFCLTWLFPYLKKTYDLSSIEAGWYSAAPFFAGAVGNVFAGALIDWIYRKGRWKVSRQMPAMMGFALAALGLLVSLRMNSAGFAVFWFSIAIFGADMTLAPSWAFCTDIGRDHAGAVSGTMNMAGNIGSFVTSLAFPYLLAWTGTPTVFFYVAAGLNLLAIAMWTAVKPEQPLKTQSTGPHEE
ncbi:MAG: MFS transporter [Verrucomicrobia bacterium]|nr:MFS transporter [Verrucomicrobiota bacterium]